MLKDKIRTLDFFRELRYADIDKLNDGEKAHLLRAIDDIGSQLLVEPKVKPVKRGRTFTDEKWSQTYDFFLKDTVLEFKKDFDKIITAITKPREGVAEWIPYEGITRIPDGPDYGHVLEEFLIDLLPFERSINAIGISATIGVASEDKTEDNYLYVRWDPDWREKSLIRISANVDVKTGLLLGFLKAINGLTPSAVRLCPACDQVYFHLSKRSGRKYCSDKCTRKEQVRRHRKKQKAQAKKKRARPK